MKAFPRADGRYDSSQLDEKGMDLRDYFAAKALQSLIPVSTKAIADKLITSKNVVDASYEWADLMMKAREVK
ncbi:MAG: hypothetical protein EBU08_01045 [Micrococcales bacterium]|nr:hypothetical protein [Micrococcales bacterium]